MSQDTVQARASWNRHGLVVRGPVEGSIRTLYCYNCMKFLFD